MEISSSNLQLRSKIVNFLTSLPNIHDSNSQRALIYHAGLDDELQAQITLGRPSGEFFSLLVATLTEYGQLHDGRNAIEAVLEAAKTYVGREKREYCESLIQELHANLLEKTQPVQQSKAFVQLVLEGEIQHFNQTTRSNLVSILSAILKIDENAVKILQVIPGSIRVTIELPSESAKRLLMLFNIHAQEILPFIDQFRVKEVLSIDHIMPADKMKTKILFLGANPSTTSRLRLDEEVKKIQTNLKLAKERDNLKIEEEWAVTTDTLMQAILDESPNIIHFSGHGQQDGIILQNDSGESKVVQTEALSQLFRLFKDSIKCVVLNACYSESQAKAIRKYIPHVIGMKAGMSDKAAIAFSTGFYKALGAGRDVSFAFELGRTAIQLEGLSGDDMPVLL